MPASRPTLGTLLRHLLELVDGDVERVYRDAGLDYRPRFTPVMRTVAELGPSSIRTIAERASLTHSAASQTVAEMVARHLVRVEAGSDRRERIVHLSREGEEMLPLLRSYWAATNAAAAALGEEVGADLEALLHRTVLALHAVPYHERILATKKDAASVQPPPGAGG